VTSAVSADEDAARLTVAPTVAPGSSSVTTGASLSTLIVVAADVVSLPATSVTTTRRSAGPSAMLVVSRAWR
jgi:hypothetical protein